MDNRFLCAGNHFIGSGDIAEGSAQPDDVIHVTEIPGEVYAGGGCRLMEIILGFCIK